MYITIQFTIKIHWVFPFHKCQICGFMKLITLMVASKFEHRQKTTCFIIIHCSLSQTAVWDNILIYIHSTNENPLSAKLLPYLFSYKMGLPLSRMSSRIT